MKLSYHHVKNKISSAWNLTVVPPQVLCYQLLKNLSFEIIHYLKYNFYI